MNYAASLKSISKKLASELLLGTVARILLPLPTLVALRSLSVSPILDFLSLLIATCLSVNAFCLTIVDNFILPQLLRASSPQDLKPSTFRFALILSLVSYVLILLTTGILFLSYKNLHPSLYFGPNPLLFTILFAFPLFSAFSIINQYFLAVNIHSHRFHVANTIFILSSTPGVLFAWFFASKVGPLSILIIPSMVSILQIALYGIDLRRSPEVYTILHSKQKVLHESPLKRIPFKLKSNYHLLATLILAQAGSFVFAVTPLFASLSLSDTNSLVFIQSRKIFDLIPSLLILPCVTLLGNRMAKLSASKSDIITFKYLTLFISCVASSTFLLIAFSPYIIKIAYGDLFDGRNLIITYQSLSLLLTGLPVVAVNAIISRMKILSQLPSEAWQSTIMGIVPIITLPFLTNLMVGKIGFYGVSLSVGIYYWLIHLPALAVIELLLGSSSYILKHLLLKLMPSLICLSIVNLPFVLPILDPTTSIAYMPSMFRLLAVVSVNLAALLFILLPNRTFVVRKIFEGLFN